MDTLFWIFMYALFGVAAGGVCSVLMPSQNGAVYAVKKQLTKVEAAKCVAAGFFWPGAGLVAIYFSIKSAFAGIMAWWKNSDDI